MIDSYNIPIVTAGVDISLLHCGWIHGIAGRRSRLRLTIPAGMGLPNIIGRENLTNAMIYTSTRMANLAISQQQATAFLGVGLLGVADQDSEVVSGQDENHRQQSQDGKYHQGGAKN